MKRCIMMILLFVNVLVAAAQTSEVVVLNADEAKRLRRLVKTDACAGVLYDSIARVAEQYKQHTPQPLKVLHYEGLLDNNPNRVITTKSLNDIDAVVNLTYAWYGNPQATYAKKVKAITLAWANNYVPNGNTINEHKFVPLFWAYHLFKKRFSTNEKLLIERWIRAIASAQMNRPKTPANNWEAKRQIIIATAGCVTDNDSMMNYAIRGLKQYIHTAYYADGTSNDLKDRDALHYHVSGIKPAIAAFINSRKFHPGFQLFNYVAPNGASIRKSVEYTLPYATGQKTRKEWTNTTVALDKRRAEAGLTKYQPGMLFNPGQAKEMFDWACFYNPHWCSIFTTSGEKCTGNWVGLLNSGVVRTDKDTTAK